MLTASRALTLNSQSAPELPRGAGRDPLYKMGVRPRQGEVIMVAGRSGTQKSGFALWWVANMKLRTLYFSADMSAFQASVRLACTVSGHTTEQVERGTGVEHLREDYFRQVDELPITFSFGAPITWRGVDTELDAYVELWNAYPEVIVIDNLMDIDGASSDYTAQMEAMQNISDISRMTGATVIVLHHASDKGWEAKSNPWAPPRRDEIKNGMAEKPELSLTVALDPTSYMYRIACVKQRMGPSDPSAQNFAVLRAEPERTRFHTYDFGQQPLEGATPA